MDSLPLVVNENSYFRDCRMVLVIGTIICIVLFIIYTYSYHEYNFNLMNTDDIKKEGMESSIIKKNIVNNVVNTKTIIIYNLNKDKLPVQDVMFIDEKNKLHYLNLRDVEISQKNGGISMKFTLPKNFKIKQIILDINKFNGNRHNITTTQIKLLDEKNNVVWYNKEPLKSGNRYVYVYIVKHNIIYPAKSQRLCDGSGKYDCVQENILNRTLQENTWD